MRQSECRVCPSYVIRCAHLGEERVVLANSSQRERCASHQFTKVSDGFSVSGPALWQSPCSNGNCSVHHIQSRSIRSRSFPTLPDAEAEFVRREALLLR